MPFRRATEIHSEAGTATRYAPHGEASREAEEIYRSSGQLIRLLGEIRKHAEKLKEVGNAPAREAADKIIKIVDDL